MGWNTPRFTSSPGASLTKPWRDTPTPAVISSWATCRLSSVREAATESLARMRNGESGLAVHPGCGTNYVVAGALAGTLAWLGMTGAKTGRQRLERLPLVILLSALGFLISQPLAPVIQQRITTSGDPGSLAIVDVYRVRRGVHRIVTRG